MQKSYTYSPIVDDIALRLMFFSSIFASDTHVITGQFIEYFCLKPAEELKRMQQDAQTAAAIKNEKDYNPALGNENYNAIPVDCFVRWVQAIPLTDVPEKHREHFTELQKLVTAFFYEGLRNKFLSNLNQSLLNNLIAANCNGQT